MLRIEELSKIKKPIVWSLHDMWAFTGGCHYDEDCGRYINKCEKCPILGSEDKRDLSARIFERKIKTFKDLDITIVGVSKWLELCAKQSQLLRNKRIMNIPNPLNTEIYKPVNKNLAKELLGIAANQKIILFGALNISQPRKGYKLLSEALTYIRIPNISFAFFGSSVEENIKCSNNSVLNIGKLNDDISLRIIYSAADVMIVPSLQEAFGQTATEAMACGTPVVAFGASGLLDIIDHKENGYLAKPYDVEDLTRGIKWVLEHPHKEDLSVRAYNKVINNFEMTMVAKKYKILYDEILNG
jgi:glycosyltransferase involved in cell wall biosynthesis